ncbi:hypothetical protein L3X07_13040 [Levilactobacillus brevis]|nr:hypothetical protein [Levilactobacillus brevis]
MTGTSDGAAITPLAPNSSTAPTPLTDLATTSGNADDTSNDKKATDKSQSASTDKSSSADTVNDGTNGADAIAHKK